MENKLYLTELYDYYKELLTEKERVYFEEYYFEDLTQEEIAENYEVSKNAVSKTLIEGIFSSGIFLFLINSEQKYSFAIFHDL